MGHGIPVDVLQPKGKMALGQGISSNVGNAGGGLRRLVERLAENPVALERALRTSKAGALALPGRALRLRLPCACAVRAPRGVPPLLRAPGALVRRRGGLEVTSHPIWRNEALYNMCCILETLLQNPTVTEGFEAHRIDSICHCGGRALFRSRSVQAP